VTIVAQVSPGLEDFVPVVSVVNFKCFAVIASWIKRAVGRNAIFELK
jgi:hypothetical protein